ncbi:hypothetical protein T484DRAFT_1820867, partial [Baffinella frigidus]
ALAGEFDHLLTDAKVLIRNPAYFAKCSKLLLTTPASHLRAYMRFRVVVGQESRVPRWYKCFKSVSNALPDYVGKVFVQRYFSMDILTQRYFSMDILTQAREMLHRTRDQFQDDLLTAQEMLHRIRDQFQDDLLTVPWMQFQDDLLTVPWMQAESLKHKP